MKAIPEKGWVERKFTPEFLDSSITDMKLILSMPRIVLEMEDIKRPITI
jgi:hypothetical protein